METTYKNSGIDTSDSRSLRIICTGLYCFLDITLLLIYYTLTLEGQLREYVKELPLSKYSNNILPYYRYKCQAILNNWVKTGSLAFKCRNLA